MDLKRLILSRDLERIREGVQRLRAHGDAARFERFLAGCDVTGRTLEWHERFRLQLLVLGSEPEAFDEIVPNELLAFGPYTRPFRQAAIRALAAYAPPGSVTGIRLRNAVRHLYCDGADKHPVDLEPLAEYPNLETLVLDRVGELVNRPALAAAPRLSTLVLSQVDGDLSGLSSPVVTTLRLAQYAQGGPDITAFPALRTLVTDGSVARPRPGDRLPALTEAALCSVRAAEIVPLIAQSPLQRLVIRYDWDGAGRGRELAPLTATPTLAALELWRAGAGDLTPLGELRSLRSVSLRGLAEDADLGVLARLPNLEELELTYTTLHPAVPRTVAAVPALAALGLHGSIRVRCDLPPVAG